MKRCCTCKQEKPLSEFGKCSTRYDGFQQQCRPCKSETYARWRERNKDAISERNAEKYRANREVVCQKAKSYRDRQKSENPEAVRKATAERMRRWRDANRERSREANRQWFRDNPDKSSAKTAKRRADLLNRCSLLTPEGEAKIKALYGLAQYLTEKFGTPYHVDHIVPLRGKTCSGLHVPENLRVVPAQLNLSKGAKIDYELVPHAFRTDTANDA